MSCFTSRFGFDLQLTEQYWDLYKLLHRGHRTGAKRHGVACPTINNFLSDFRAIAALARLLRLLIPLQSGEDIGFEGSALAQT